MIRVLDSADSTLVELGRQQQQHIEMHVMVFRSLSVVLVVVVLSPS